MRKQRLREVKKFVHNHTASTWKSHNLNPGCGQGTYVPDHYAMALVNGQEEDANLA
jgi:hypothetical protein